jgi:hypothetical protein
MWLPPQLLCSRRFSTAIRAPEIQHASWILRYQRPQLILVPRDGGAALWQPALFLTKIIDSLGSVLPSNAVGDCEVEALTVSAMRIFGGNWGCVQTSFPQSALPPPWIASPRRRIKRSTTSLICVTALILFPSPK